MYHITTGLTQISLNAEDEIYTQEGISSFFEWLGEIGTSINKAYRTTFQMDTVAVITQAKQDVAVFQYLEKATLTQIGKFKINRPSRLDEPMLEWLNHLKTQATLLADIETRLYDPVIKYLAMVTVDSDNGSKLWNPKELRFNDMKSFEKGMNKFLSNKNDHDEMADFEDVYPRSSHVYESLKVIIEIQELLGEVSIDRIIEKEKRVVELINTLLSGVGPNIDIAMSKPNKIKLAASLTAVAEEAEIFTVTIYEFNKAIVAFNAGVSRIREQLI